MYYLHEFYGIIMMMSSLLKGRSIGPMQHIMNKNSNKRRQKMFKCKQGQFAAKAIELKEIVNILASRG